MKFLFLFILLICSSLLGYAQYLQHVENLLPCPLCVAQRVAYWLIGLISLLAFLRKKLFLIPYQLQHGGPECLKLMGIVQVWTGNCYH